ncbi:hypothetical protein [Anaeromicrobium sediminis]|uniref:Rubrerythrin diiron-binding domain-containing protein n=1 Tax=Anaeromicrobium sediminis TaxID=1478221 RepID=A0A267MM96_9FIRM|nr:hypothetical protein [Anaeromicrobium sediminis]PAB59923.1 hypothetical protein CCE28_08190 [Anaeromicrobium sediminis]
MKNEDILKDLLGTKTENQRMYNEFMIKSRNPELRKLFLDLRDDEMRYISELQQKIEKLEAKPNILSHVFSTRLNN